MTRPAELRDMDDEELLNRLAESKQELFNLRFQHVTGQLDNYARLPQLKKDVARINTILREREIAAAEAIEANEAIAPPQPAAPSAADHGDQATAAIGAEETPGA
ncbi:MAG: 50S ribosomal protein L29 [Acidimicrobiia bacterium]|nr:50S ribosomal protein L29 [Acidimicrobiia bacterium]